MKLSDGTKIERVGSLKEFEFIYNEIFNEKVYLKNGLSIKDGDCIVDVGANIGLFSLFCTESFKNLKIYSFEPSPPTFRVLAKNIKNLQKRNSNDVKVFNFGFSDIAGTKDLHFYSEVPGISSLDSNNKNTNLEIFLKDSAKYAKLSSKFLYYLSFILFPFRTKILERAVKNIFKEQKYACSFRRLSDVIREENIPSIDFLKMDVEGAEIDVFKGIDVDHWDKIRQISMEVHSSALLKEVISILDRHHYTVTYDASPIGNDTFNLYGSK